MLPLVTSHGRNDPRADRPPLWKEFDWQGTGNPTPFLALPEAIRLVGSLQPGGWPAHLSANRELVLAGRDMLNDRLGLEPIAPDSMVGSMASIALSAQRYNELSDYEQLADALVRRGFSRSARRGASAIVAG